LWEDDRQDDGDAHVDRGGPNRGTLWQARSCYLKFGACEEVAKQHVRQPTPDEPKFRHWSLVDDVAVELIPSTDVTPWNLLHDGSVVELVRSGERVPVTVEISYLRTRFDEPGDALRLELLQCSKVEYVPYDGHAISCLKGIAEAEPEIGEGTHEDGDVWIWGSAGGLRLCYRDLALRFDSGAPLALAALGECARVYWDEA
jgi:hypothetical protein